MTLPAELLRQAAAAAATRQPGAWLSAYRYERELADAFERVLREIAGDGADLSQQHANLDDSHADMIAVVGDHIVFVEAKVSQWLVPKDAIRQLVRHLKGLSTPDRRHVGLLVSNADFSRSAIDEIAAAQHAGAVLRAVQWKSQEDDDALAEALREVLAA
ncbi:restriction endonuclease [Sphaerisporangium rubeum]|uniref:Phosphatidylserine/phosphatidylglycerophosphate/ cardiolipin synthase-like enzyme n=1 Tax=Sphaerisporangium rubeum TaxID=321317 RepID=A0A7X0IJQ4_9ACTN|nr:phosphatidylserine/phosphatidylglycerophosphate/cardiolipin synthase-like enzyme [Sphaerisporangium rubeum]